MTLCPAGVGLVKNGKEGGRELHTYVSVAVQHAGERKLVTSMKIQDSGYELCGTWNICVDINTDASRSKNI